MSLQAPFPFFGGKSKVADIVWEALGNVDHYIEPFFGSGAVLLARPNYVANRDTETVCDADGFVSNVWRSLKFSPDETAKWCDWPVNHADLSARKKALIKNEDRLLKNLCDSDTWHDPVMAGYWIWAASCWIGAGLTSVGQRPNISDAGKGVHKIGKIPHISFRGSGVHKIEAHNENIYAWFSKLSKRLRYVRVVCGDWTRVCGGNWQDKIGTVGMFFDPPYGVDDRSEVYHCDSITITKDVLAWCRERGKNSNYRIVLAGYDEYEILKDEGWTSKAWKAQGGYGNLGNEESQGKKNRMREKLWFNPACLRNDLFAKRGA